MRSPRPLHVGLLALALVFTVTTVAYAFHEVRAHHPNDPSYGVVFTDHHSMAVCDWHADGHETWIGYHLAPGSEYFRTGSDTYGADYEGLWCLRQFATGWGVQKFRICVSYEGCSAFRHVQN